MDRGVAEKIVVQTRKMDVVLGELHDIVLGIPDEAERNKLIRAWGELVWDVFDKVTREVIKHYPDLDPDRDDPRVSRRRARDSD